VSEKLEKRMDKKEEINEAVWKISSNVEMMTQQLKETNVRFNDHIQRLYEKIEKQGEANASAIQELSKRIDEIEKKPAKRWDAFVAQITAIIVAAVVGFVVANIGLGG
jgi:ElaB/YqjD/DUF883 family membrane-anchored ribosome-binding protein